MQPFNHRAFSFGAHYLMTHLDVNNTDSKLQSRLVFEGPAAFLSYSY